MGCQKKHRGAGNRGGRGMAGSGKRADQKKPSILQEYGSRYFGRFGFKVPNKKILEGVNLELIEKNFDKWAKKEGSDFVIDVTNYGYDKVLGKGKLTKKAKIIARAFSKNAITKIEEIGGQTVTK